MHGYPQILFLDTKSTCQVLLSHIVFKPRKNIPVLEGTTHRKPVVTKVGTVLKLPCFNSQKLRDINQMLKQGAGETSRKRALLQDDKSSQPPTKRTSSEEVLQRKLTSMMEERQASASR